MRTIVCLSLLLAACASHDVRCDGKLRPINLPSAGVAAPAAPTAAAAAVAGAGSGAS